MGVNLLSRGLRMAPDRAQALQDTFLDHLRKHEVPVTMFLTNGVRLQGYVGRFDSYSVLLVRDRQVQLVYKHAISTIMPGEPIQMERSDEQQRAEV